ncbi:MAG: hypothetical protein ACYTFM_12375 [Planctomycetota bacterium]|jgi:hypothetical protein
MTQKTPAGNPIEKRAETRETLEKMKSVELKLPKLPVYVFKVKDTSPSGICFLVKADSDILNHIKEGQVLNLKYHTEDTTNPSEALTSEIKHITKMDKGPYKEHRLIGLKILEK